MTQAATDRDTPRLGRMLELAMAPNRGYQDPPVSFEHPDYLSDLHSESLTDMDKHRRSTVVSSSAELEFDTTLWPSNS